MAKEYKFFSVGHDVIITEGRKRIYPLREFKVVTIDGRKNVCRFLILRIPKPCIVIQKVETENNKILLDAVLLMTHILVSWIKKYDRVMILKSKHLKFGDLPGGIFKRNGCFYIAEKDKIRKAKDEKEMLQFDEYYSHPYWAPWNVSPINTRNLDRLLKYTEPNDRVLEIGIGFGRNVSYLLNSGLDIYGIDISSSAVEIAKRSTELGEKLKAASILSTPFPDSSFDAVLDVGCLHCLHNDELEDAIAEIYRILKPGGYFVSSFLLMAFFDTKGVFRDTGFTLNRMRETVEKSFEIIESTSKPKSASLVAEKRDE